jgi:hypothetical protein
VQGSVRGPVGSIAAACSGEILFNSLFFNNSNHSRAEYGNDLPVLLDEENNPGKMTGYEESTFYDEILFYAVCPVQAHKIPLSQSFSAGSLVSSVGKLLDRGISALMGGGTEGKAAAGKHARSGSIVSDQGALSHGMQPSQGSHMESPSSHGGAGPGVARSGSSQQLAEVPQSSAPQLLSSLVSRVASLKNIVTPSPPTTSRCAAMA